MVGDWDEELSLEHVYSNPFLILLFACPLQTALYAAPYKSNFLKALSKGEEVKEEDCLANVRHFLLNYTVTVDAIYDMYTTLNAELDYTVWRDRDRRGVLNPHLLSGLFSLVFITLIIAWNILMLQNPWIQATIPAEGYVFWCLYIIASNCKIVIAAAQRSHFMKDRVVVWAVAVWVCWVSAFTCSIERRLLDCKHCYLCKTYLVVCGVHCFLSPGGGSHLRC